MSSESEVPRARRRLTVIVPAIFGLFYAYDLEEAVGSLLQAPAVYKSFGQTVPWGFLIAGVVAPVLIFVVALLLSRRQRLFGRSVVLFVGLALAASLSLTLIEVPGLL
jgi:hypothetical protein